MSSSTASLSLDHPQLFLGEQLCYLHCYICDTVLAVSVPCSSLFKTVTVRCGHCTNLLPVNIGGIKFQSENQPHLDHSFLSQNQHNLLEMFQNQTSNFFSNHGSANANGPHEAPFRALTNELPRPPIINRPPEKRPRVPSAYNRFIKDEIQRIKAGNPEISHREAFSAAAKNWAHFPHIQFGLMSDQTTARKGSICQQVAGKDHAFLLQ